MPMATVRSRMILLLMSGALAIELQCIFDWYPIIITFILDRHIHYDSGSRLYITVEQRKMSLTHSATHHQYRSLIGRLSFSA